MYLIIRTGLSLIIVFGCCQLRLPASDAPPQNQRKTRCTCYHPGVISPLANLIVLCSAPAIAYQLTEPVKPATCLSNWRLLLTDIVLVLRKGELSLGVVMKVSYSQMLLQCSSQGSGSDNLLIVLRPFIDSISSLCGQIMLYLKKNIPPI